MMRRPVAKEEGRRSFRPLNPTRYNLHPMPCLSTHHSREAPPDTIFEFRFSSFAGPSPVHPCELKSPQLIENKGSSQCLIYGSTRSRASEAFQEAGPSAPAHPARFFQGF